MRERLHYSYGPAAETPRARLANFDPTLIEPTLQAQPTVLGGGGGKALGYGGVGAHHGVVGLVLVAVLVLFLLDKAGFRFAVTVGRR